MSVIVFLAATSVLSGGATGIPNALEPGYSFVTVAEGRVSNVCWVEPKGRTIRLHSVLTRSKIIDATVKLREDGTCEDSSVILQDCGSPAGMPIRRTFEPGVVYWSDMVTGSIEAVIRRARELGGAITNVTVGSFYRAGTEVISVARTSETRWQFDIHHKHYMVVTDGRGNMLAATLPEFGVVIERRSDFKLSQFQPWPVNGAPAGGPYRAKQISISRPTGPAISGTLTLPLGSKKAGPAALLIGGLGGGNRNGGSPPWMPLRDLADELSGAGVAVLRVDTPSDTKAYTIELQLLDIAAEVKWLRSQSAIDPRRVTLVGYSAGSLCAIMTAVRDRQIAGVVSLAGTGVPGEELARYQITNHVLADPSIAEQDRAAEIKNQLDEPLTAREASFLKIDPLAFARKVRCPLLVLQGANDWHVPLASAELLGSAARSNGNGGVAVECIPGVSHSLLADPNGDESGWLYLPSHATSPRVLTRVSIWTRQHLFGGKG